MNTGDSSDIEELDDSGSEGNYPGVADYESAHPSPRSSYFQYPYGASQMFSSVAPNFAQHPLPPPPNFAQQPLPPPPQSMYYASFYPPSSKLPTNDPAGYEVEVGLCAWCALFRHH